MARPIDEKLVVMKMDNSDLAKKAAETTSIFGKLRNALSKIPSMNLSKPAKDLERISSAASHVDLSGLSRAADAITSRFSNLGVVATTALTNITNKAVDAGLQLYKSVTTQPIIDGFNEYETKIGAIGTMLANTEWAGSTLKDVKKTLGELNNYADKTIYNFGEMTSSIGRFTAAGVTLEDSAIAIKGLGNLAAVSGASSEQLNTAMYQMSQALASGKLNLEDWNSLVNAGMAGKKTQDALVATAKAMGKNVDLSKGFRNSIQDGWLTSKVFLNTLKKFGKDESMTKAATSVRTLTGFLDGLKESIGSGWATTWELIFGDFDQATKRWTAVSQVVGGFFQKQTNARNKLIKSLADKGVFQTMFDGFVGAGNAVLKVVDAIGKGISKAFGHISVSGIIDMAKGFKDFAMTLKPSKQTLENISTIFQAIGSVIKTVVVVAIALGKALISMIPPDLVSNIISFVAQIAKMVIAFTDGINSGKKLDSTASGLGGVLVFLGNVAAAVSKGFSKLGDAVSEVWSILAKGSFSGKGPWSADSKVVSGLLKIREAFQAIGQYLSGVNVSFTPVANMFSRFFDMLGQGFDWVKQKIADFKKAIANMMPSGDKLLAGGFIAGLVAIVAVTFKMAKKLFDVFTGWGSIGNSVSELLESVGGALDGFSKAMTANAVATTVISVAIALGILAVSLKIMSTINPDKVASSLTALVTSLTGLIGAMAIMSKYDITGTGLKAAIQLVALSVAFSILAGALKKLSGMKWGEIAKGITGLVVVMGAFSGAVALMSKFGGAKVGASALQMVALAGAMYLMLGVVKQIATVDVGVLTKGVLAMGAIMIEMGLFMKLAGGTKFGVGSTLGMLAIGKAIMNITNTIKEISTIDTANLVLGLKTIGLILAEVAAFALITGKVGLFSAGLGMMAVAAGITALVGPIAIMGNMNLSTLAIGLTAMSVALLAIAGSARLAGGVNLLAMGAGLLLVAAAMNVLLIPITAFATMGWGPMLTGMAGLALSLGLIGGAALLLAPAIPLLSAFGLGVLALGAGMALAGGGMMLFGTGLMMLATMTAGAVTSIVAVIGTLLVGLASLIPTAVDFIVKLVVQIAGALASKGPIVAAKLAQLIISLLDVLIKYAPQFVDKGATFIMKLLEGLGKAVPKLISGAIKFMVQLVEGMAKGIRDNGPRLINAVMDLMGEILVLIVKTGVAVIKALFGWIPGVNGAAEKIGKSAEKVIRDSFGAEKAGRDKGKDFANALGGKAGDAKSAGNKVGKAGRDGTDLANFKTVGSGAGTDFASGLSSKISAASSSGKHLANGGKSGAGSVSMSSTGYHFGSGFASGISSAYHSVVSKAKSLAQAAKNAVTSWLDINSPSRVMRVDGGWFGEGFALGIGDKAKSVSKHAKNLAVTAKESLNRFLDGFQLPEGDNEIHFKAVVDYDKINPSKFGNLAPVTVKPDTSLTSGLVTATKADLRQNGNNNPGGNVDNSRSTITNHYAVNVEAKGYSTRAEIKKIAEQVQTEIKNLNDRGKMSRGEEVAF